MTDSQRQPAIFLDRDGTIMQEEHYCRDPERVRLVDGAHKALQQLRDAGFKLVIVTNQSGIGRGIITPKEYAAVHARLLELLGEELITATYYCPDTPENSSDRRKPAPGMILDAARDLHLDLSRSYMIGDKASDIECGRRAGTGTVMVKTGYGSTESAEGADFAATDLTEAAGWILARREA